MRLRMSGSGNGTLKGSSVDDDGKRRWGVGFRIIPSLIFAPIHRTCESTTPTVQVLDWGVERINGMYSSAIRFGPPFVHSHINLTCAHLLCIQGTIKMQRWYIEAADGAYIDRYFEVPPLPVYPCQPH